MAEWGYGKVGMVDSSFYNAGERQGECFPIVRERVYRKMSGIRRKNGAGRAQASFV